MAADGSVEIRITGSVDPSVAASANQAKASFDGLTIAQASLARQLAAGTLSMQDLNAVLGKSAEAQKALMAITAAAAASKTADAVATEVETVATTTNTAAKINNQAVTEGLVLVHEILQGRYTKLAGSSLIFTQLLAGQGAVASAVAFAMTGVGAAILGTVAVLALATAATISFEAEEKKLIATSVGLGAQSGLTAEQLKKIGDSANVASQSIKETTQAAQAFAGAGIKNAETVKILSNSVEAYSQLIGVKFADAEKKLATAMEDPVKGAKELHDQLGILDGDQLTQIQRLTELGDKEGATAIITDALKHRIDEARVAGVGLRGEFGQLVDTLSNVYHWVGEVDAAFGKEVQTIEEYLIPALGRMGAAHRQAAADAAHQAQQEAQLNKISAKGKEAYDQTPEGRAANERNKLQGNLNAAKDALKVDMALHGAHSEAVKRDQQAVAAFSHAVGTYRTEVQKKLDVDAIDVKLAAAKHSHNKQLVADLTQQKALIQESGKIESEADAKALSRGKGDVAGAKVHAPKGRGGKGPDIVSEWTEQLHSAEIATNNFFADETETEKKFWETKLGLTKAGSKDWLAVQGKIYSASKTLARRDYQDHIADLDEKLAADKDNFQKFQADWTEKLNFVKSKYGEESNEYKKAHKAMLKEEEAFQDKMIKEELTGNSKQITALKAHLASETTLRAEYAKIIETELSSKKSGGSEISSAIKIGELHHQMALAEMADAEKVYQQENTLRTKGLADALRVYGVDDVRYKAAVQDKATADQAYYDKKKQMAAKALAQELADIKKLKDAYHQYIDGTVQASVSGFTKMLEGTGTWRDAVIGIYNSIKSSVEQIISQMIENWIVNLLVGKAKQSAVASAQVVSYSAVAGAAGVASYAAAPWPIDMGAPAFGAAMASAAAAFAPAASLAQGTNMLPGDMIIQAHEGERIMPKADNTKLMQVLEMATGGGGGGGVHLHSSPVFNGNQASMWQHMVDKHERDMVGWMKRQFHNGKMQSRHV